MLPAVTAGVVSHYGSASRHLSDTRAGAPMITFRDFLQEDKSGKLMHLTHLEDLMLDAAGSRSTSRKTICGEMRHDTRRCFRQHTFSGQVRLWTGPNRHDVSSTQSERSKDAPGVSSGRQHRCVSVPAQSHLDSHQRRQSPCPGGSPVSADDRGSLRDVRVDDPRVAEGAADSHAHLPRTRGMREHVVQQNHAVATEQVA